MRNLLLVARREYLEKVRTKSFLVSTIALPALMLLIIVLPQKLSTMKAMGTRKLAVVASNARVAQAVKQNLLNDKGRTGVKYAVELVTPATEEQRQRLTQRVESGELDGFLWLSDDALAERKISYSGRELSDFMDLAGVKMAVTYARMQNLLATSGVSPEKTRDLLEDVKIDTIRIARGKASKTSTRAGFLTSFIMVMLLYTTLLLYGVSVMRAVLEEKTSRVMEVLLSSVTSRDLMSGKIIGVGAVGLTQILIWIVLVVVVGLPMAMSSGALKDVDLSPWAVGAFAIFFVLGYLLYSTIYAAIGALVNSEQEGQQLQFFGIFPLIVAISLMMLVYRQPNSPLAAWCSMVPFFAPILMYLRISVQPPPVWQIALCIALLAATVGGMMVLCGRIYRVGILMYGKRPTLPEILKWLRYA